MRNKQKKKSGGIIKFFQVLLLIVLLAALVLVVIMANNANKGLNEPEASPTPTPVHTPQPTPEPTPEPVGVANFEPHCVDGTEPERLIASTEIMVDGEVTENYTPKYEINFDLPEKYTELEGVLGFRGNNFRNSAAYSTAKVTDKTLNTLWSKPTSGLSDSDGNYWSGSGWTGQPIIVKWPAETRKNMIAMYEWAREKEELVEVIYATLDGNIYFYELETGEYTRDPLKLGYTFKGAGALDPRGYPILYLGSGVHSINGRSRAFVVNLIDNSVMYEFGQNESFANRNWNMFDSSPLVSAETDQLIYPGENGILYIIHLNTKYNEKTGELSVDPDNIVKWKYNGVRTGTSYWLGIESSAAIINHYIFLADNGGNLMCLDLNTLELVWVQDTLDDTNCTPVVDIEEGHPYIYISTSFHYGWRSYSTATVPIWKIDAETGEIIWQTDYECYTVADLSGGVQGTIAVGKNNLSDLIFVPVARTPSASGGVLAALNKETGEIVWEKQTMTYSWSSPVDFYDENGDGYLLYCNSGFYMFLLDGRTGEELDYINFGGNIEASPAVYGNLAVVGSRSQRTYCVEIG